MAGATGEPPSGPGQPDSPDDIDKRLREIEAELHKPARFKEPSAAERARKPGLRDRRKARKLRKPVAGHKPVPVPDHWRSGPAQPAKASRSRGRALSLLIAVVVVAGLAAAAIELPKLGLHKTPAASDTTPVKNDATPASRPSASPARASYLPTPTLAAPFLGTPAQSYADGAAGIIVPPAHPVGGYSAAEVTHAYRTTKKLLVAADLNVTTLNGGAPSAFANLLAPQQRTQFLASLDKTGLNSKGGQRSTRTWVIAFAPGTELAGNVIKVQGTMQASTYEDDGSPVLRIQVNYLVVYAVMEPGTPSSLMRIVVHDEGLVSFGTWDDPGGPLEPWWQMPDTVAGMKCGAADGYIHPQFPVSTPGKVRPTGPAVNPYDQGASLYSGCRNTTGT